MSSLDRRLQRVEEKALRQLRRTGGDRLGELLPGIAAGLEDHWVDELGYSREEAKDLAFPHWVLEATRWLTENREAAYTRISDWTAVRRGHHVTRDTAELMGLADVLSANSTEFLGHLKIAPFTVMGAGGFTFDRELPEALQRVKEVSERKRLHKRKE